MDERAKEHTQSQRPRIKRANQIAEALLRATLAWSEEAGVERIQLNAVPAARSLYERVGFTTPDARLMELRVNR